MKKKYPFHLLVDYGRFEGRKAWASLYRVLRQYINILQPSMKLLSKETMVASSRNLATLRRHLINAYSYLNTSALVKNQDNESLDPYSYRGNWKTYKINSGDTLGVRAEESALKSKKSLLNTIHLPIYHRQN